MTQSQAASIFDYQPTPEKITESFRTDLAELEESMVELAKRMQDMGDHRSYQAILRSIQRMAAGDTGVSGEMRVIVRALLRQQRRREKKYTGLKWQRQANGTKNYFYEDASFVRLRNLSLAVDLAKLARMPLFQRLQVVLTGRNLVTFTDYTGYDPEVSSGASNSAFDRGVDHNTIPNLKSYQVGLNIGF